MRMKVFCFALLLIWGSSGFAHEIRPAYLQINQVTEHEYNLLWKVPTNNNLVQNIRPVFEPQFSLSPLPNHMVINGFVLFQYRLNADTELAGTTLTIENLNRTTIDTLINIKMLNGSQYSLLMKPNENTLSIPSEGSIWQIITSYTKLGIEHILEGWDHLAFVAALMLIVRGWVTLFKTITAFTLAHSITLGLATFGYVSLPPPPVEALIALSILLIAAESIRIRHNQHSLTTKWPWLVAFIFGLLHGFGFAGALKDIGLPQVDVPAALLFFNLGVELGQLFFITAILGTVAITKHLIKVPKPAATFAAYGIGSLACFWLIERIEGMFF